MFDDDGYADTRERFMTGGCHALASELSALTGWPMVAIWLRAGRREGIAHVAVMAPGDDVPESGMREFLDAGGLRGLPEILIELDTDQDETVRFQELDAAGLARLCAPSRPGYRKLCEMTPDLVAEARALAPLVVDAAGLGIAPPGTRP